MDTQEKKKKTYKITSASAPEPLPPSVTEPASDPPKKKRVAKVAPVIEPIPLVIVEEPKKKRSYKVKNAIEEAPVAVAPVPVAAAPAPVPVVEEPKKKRSYKVKTEAIIAPIPVAIPEPVVVVEEPKKKRSYKVRPEAAVAVTPPVVTVPVKKERKKRVVKVSQPHVAEQLSIKPKAIESSEAPLLINDEDVITINVRKFEHNGKYYFLNSAKDKLYTVGTDGQPFQYHGRYNRETETIDTDFGDSDAEN